MQFNTLANPTNFPSFFKENLDVKQKQHLLGEEEKVAQVNKSEIKALSALSKKHSKSYKTFDKRLFGLESGDNFIKNTAFEGANFSTSIDRFSNCLETALEEIENETGESVNFDLTGLHEAAKLAEEIKKLQGDVEDFDQLKDLKEKTLKNIKDLEKGKTFWFPGGYTGHPSGHAMIYIIEKTLNNTYKFTIVNTGDGLNNHPGFSKNGRLRFQTHYTLENIKPADLCQEEVINSLFELQIIPAWYPNKEVSVDCIYQGVCKLLKGTPEKKMDPKKFPEFFQRPQISGSCAMQSLFASLRNQCLKKASNPEEGLKLFRRVKFYYTRASLRDACYDYFNKPYEKTDHRLIKSVAAKHARSARSLFKSGLLSKDELKKTEATLMDINHGLTHIKGEHLKEIEKISDQVAYDLPKANLPEIEFKWNGWFFGRDRIGKAKGISTGDIDFSKLLKASEFKGAADDVEAFLLDQYKLYEKILEKKLTAAEKEKVQAALIETVRTLPIPEKEDAFWNDLPLEKIDGCLEALYKISRLFLSLPQDDYRFKLSAEAFIETHTLTCIAQKLCFKKNELGISSEYLGIENLVAFYQTAQVQIVDPIAKDRLDKILTCRKNPHDLSEKIEHKPLYDSFKNSLFLMDDGSIHLNNISMNENIKKCRYFNFLKKCLADKDVIEKLNAQGFEKEPLINKISLLLTDSLESGNPILPKSYHFLKQIFCASELISLSKPGSEGIVGEFTYEKIVTKRQFEKTKSIEFQLKAKSISTDKEMEIRQNYLSFNGLYGNKTSTIAHEIYEIDQNELMYSSSHEADRENNIITVSGFDEVIRAVVYFENKPATVLESEKQRARLGLHFFRPGRLSECVKSDPRAAKKILNFLHQKIDFFKSKKNLEAALFFVNLAAAAANEVAFVFNDHKDRFAEVGILTLDFIRDYKEELIQQILPLAKNFLESAAVYEQVSNLIGLKAPRELLELFETEDPTCEQIAVDLLTARVLPATDGQFGFPVDSRKTQIQFDEILQTYLDSDAERLNDICNAILKRFIPNEENFEWKKTDEGVFVNSEANITLNFKNGFIQKGKALLTYLPKEVSKNQLFIKLFNNVTSVSFDDDSQSNNPNPHFIIKEGNKESKLWQTGYNHNIVIKREIEGLEYRSVLPSELSSLNNLLPASIIGSDDIIWNYEKEGFRSYHEPRHFRVEKPNGEIFYINYKVSGKSSGFKLINVTKGKLELVDPWDLVDYFAKFDDRKNIRCYVNPKNRSTLCKIEFPTYGISFKIKEQKGQLKAYSKEFPGFYIAENQYTSIRDLSEISLVLENDNGQKKFLIPKKKREFDSSTTRTAFNPVETRADATKEFIAYEIEETALGDKLKPSSPHDALYAAYLMASKKQYNKAVFYLSRSFNLGVYTATERELIKDILEVFKSDGHPSAKALSIRLFLMLQENIQKYQPELLNKLFEDYSVAFLGETYQKWVLNRSNDTACRLSVEEEKKILRIIFQGMKKTIEELKDDNIPAFVKEILIKDQLKLFPALRSRLKALVQNDDTIEDLDLRDLLDSMTKPVQESIEEVGENSFFKTLAGALKPIDSFAGALTLTEREFFEWLPTFYNLLIDGTIAEKQRIANILTLLESNQVFTSKSGMGKSSNWLHYLKAVAKRPKKFPKRNKIIHFSQFNYPHIKNDYYKKITTWHRAKEKLFKEQVNASKSGGLFDFKKWMNFFTKGVLPSIFKQDNHAESLLLQEVPELHDFLNLSLKSSNAPLDKEVIDYDIETIDPFFDKIIDKFFFKEMMPVKEESLFEEDDESPLTSAKSKEIAELMADYYKTRPKEEPFFKLSRGSSLEKLRTKLDKFIDDQSEELRKKENLILKGINTLSLENGSYQHLALLGKEIPKKKMADAISYFVLGELPEDLDREMGFYLTLRSRLFQAKNGLESLQKILDSKDLNGERELALHRLGEEMSIKRSSFSVDSEKMKRLYLVLEGQNGILLRPKQVTILDFFANYSKDPMKLISMLGTGSGKSKILAQMMQLMRRAVSPLIVNIWPTPLYPVNSFDTRSQVETSFSQRSDSLECSRNTPATLAQTRFMLREVRSAGLEARQLNAKPESVQSVELKFLETLDLAAEGVHKEAGVIKTFQELLKTFKASEAHIDESHKNLSPRHELNFTVGEPKACDNCHVETIEMIYRILLNDFKDKVNLEIHQPLLEKEDFDKFSQNLAESLVGFLGISQEQKADYLDYVCDITVDEPIWFKDHPKKEEISVVRGEIGLLLAETLSKATDTNFGLSKADLSIEYAKPYSGNDSPVEPAQYENSHETLNKTYQTYLVNRLKSPQIWFAISLLQREGMEEAKQKLCDPKDTEAYKTFEALFPKNIPRLYALTEEDIKASLTEINKNSELIFYYIKKHVAPTIQQYPEKFKSDPQNLLSCFKNCMAMSATPGAKQVYGLDVDFRRDKGSDELVLETLSQKCKDKKTIHLLDASKPKDIVQEIIEKYLPNETDFRMLIDIAALFKGVSNETLAIQLFEHFAKTNPNIKGIVFFKDDKLVSLEKTTDGLFKTIPLERSSLKPKERFTYCDHKHIFGADIKQYPQAKGLCTFDFFTVDLDDMLQGVGRLRELTKMQTVEWVMTKENAERVTPKPTFVDLRNHAVKNQAAREADDLFRSLRQQMKNEIRSYLINKLIMASSESEALSLFKDFRKFLVEQNPTSAVDLYSKPQKWIPALEALKLERKRFLNEIDKLNAISQNEKLHLKERINSYKSKIEQLKPKLPALIKTSLTMLGTEAEVLQSVQQQVEMQQDTQVYDRSGLYRRKHDSWGNNFDPYEGEWASPTSTSIKLDRFASSIFIFLKKLPLILLKPIRFAARLMGSPNGLLDFVKVGTVMSLVGLINGVAFVILFPLIAAPAIGLSLLIKGPRLAGSLFKGVFLKKGAVPLFKAEDVLKTVNSKEMKEVLSFLKQSKKGSILMTDNFIKLREFDAEIPIMTVYGKEQKTAYEVIVIQDSDSRGNKKYTLIMGDQSTDARFFRKKLLKDSMETDADKAANRKRKICLYDLRLGIVADGKNCFDEDELNNDKDFLELIVKAKIANGDLNYSENEEKMVQSLLSNYKTKKQAGLLIKKALVWKEDRKKQFEQSLISRLTTAAA